MARLSALQEIYTTKKHKYGMKLCIFNEPDGMVQAIHNYGGAADPEVRGKGHTTKVVKKLPHNKTNIG